MAPKCKLQPLKSEPEPAQNTRRWPGHFKANLKADSAGYSTASGEELLRDLVMAAACATHHVPAKTLQSMFMHTNAVGCGRGSLFMTSVCDFCCFSPETEDRGGAARNYATTFSVV